MKKAFVALMVVAAALVAQANVWNINWAFGGAFDPYDTGAAGDNPVSLFANYGITWELINETAGETIASTSLINGSVSWDDTANGGYKAEYVDFLYPDTEVTYLGSTSLTTEQSIYQKVTLIPNVADGYKYVWEGERFGVTPAADGSKAPIDLDIETIVAAEGVVFDGATMATWTKVAVPEPATMSLLGLGALAMVLRRRIRR